MKKLLLFCFILVIFQIDAFSQHCLPEGITFTTQAQIDSFQADYPGCNIIDGDLQVYGTDISNLAGIGVIDSIYGDLTIGDEWPQRNLNLITLDGLENLAYIGGDLVLQGQQNLENIEGLSGLDRIGKNIIIIFGDSLKDLSGLEGIDSLFGTLEIQQVDGLLNFTGLNNLEYIARNLNSIFNERLINLTGLENLRTIEGFLEIWGNPEMTSLTGMENLSYANGIKIESNDGLESLTGLESLDSLGQDLEIRNNYFLNSLFGLEGLSSIGGWLVIENNFSITSLAGLDNIIKESISDILIFRNQNLSECDIQNICNYIADPTGSINIYHNAPGCNNPHEIAEDCGITLTCLPYGNYYFVNQEDVDRFRSYYPNCTRLDGDIVKIIGTDIIGLDSLFEIDTINGSLIIYGNDSLSSLIGLHNVGTIQGGLFIGYSEGLENPKLISLEGLNSLISVGGNMYIYANSALINLSGLDKLSVIGGDLQIWGNGLLAECDVTSICDYLASPNGTIFIQDNAPGCNSQEELELACSVRVEEVDSRQSIVVSYPNPVSDHVTFNIRLQDPAIVNLTVYSSMGQIVTTILDESLDKGDHRVTWNAGNLSPGIYFYRLSTANCQLSTIGKLVIAR